MASADAATWLMLRYPLHDKNYGDAITLIAHRSWKRSDQIRLAEFYLRKLPFASSRVYECFASFMSLELLMKVIEKYWPSDMSNADLLLYYLLPVLNKHAKSESDRKLISALSDKTRGHRT